MESRQLTAASSLEAPTLASGASGGRNLRASRRPHPARLKAAAPPPSPPAKGLASASCAAAGFGQLRFRCRIDLSRHQIDLRRRRIELRSLQIELRLHLSGFPFGDPEAGGRSVRGARRPAEGATGARQGGGRCRHGCGGPGGRRRSMGR